MNKTVTDDRAGKEYWDDLWSDADIPTPIDPREPGCRGYPYRKFHALFQKMLGENSQGKRFLEIGCAKSAWLPYFANEFAMDAYGLDYSELGCEQAKAVLENADIKGTIVCADMFNPPDEFRGSFDVIFSHGVIEHFEDTASAVRAMSSMLKPGGILLSVVPNMRGLVGVLQKWLNYEVYRVHVPIDANDLLRAHRECDLDKIRCKYFLSSGFGVVNMHGLDHSSPANRMKINLWFWLTRLSKFSYLLEDALFMLPATRAFSPYIVCCAVRKDTADA